MDEPTIKTIYVGNDDLMKAYITTGRSLDDIQSLLDEGASVADDGSIVMPVDVEKQAVPDGNDETDQYADEQKTTTNLGRFVVPVIVVLLCIIVVIAIRKKGNASGKNIDKREKGEKKNDEESEDTTKHNHSSDSDTDGMR